MAKEVEIFFKVDGLETYITDLNDLEDILKQVQGATEATADATKNLESDIDDATKGIEESERRLNALEGGIKTLAGSFEILAGSAALLGLEDNEFFGELEKNVVGVLALSQGVIDATEGLKLLSQNTKLAAVAQRIFNKAALSNPYVLLATAVIALTAAIGGYIIKTRSAAAEEREQQKEIRRTTLELKRKNEEISKGLLEDRELRKLAAETNQQVLKDEKKAAEERIAALEKEREGAEKNLNLIETRDDANFRSTEALQRQEAARQKYIDDINAANEAIDKQQRTVDVATDRLEDLNRKREDSTELTEAETAAIEAQNLALEQAVQRQIDIANEQNQLADELAEAEEENFRRRLTEREQEERDIEDKYYERLNLANGNAALILQVEEQFEIDKRNLRDKFQEEDDEKNAERNAELIEQQKAFNEQLIAAEEQLQMAKVDAARSGFNLLSALAGENEEVQKVLFVASQAFEAAQIGIQGTKDIAQVKSETASNIAKLKIQAATQTGLGNLAGASLALGTIPAVAASGAASIAGIKLTTAAGIAGVLAATIGQLKGAKDTGGDPASVGGGVGAVSPAGVFAPPQTTQGEDILIGGVRSQQVTGGGGPIQAYVLATDVTTAQEANQQIENLSRL